MLMAWESMHEQDGNICLPIGMHPWLMGKSYLILYFFAGTGSRLTSFFFDP